MKPLLFIFSILLLLTLNIDGQTKNSFKHIYRIQVIQSDSMNIRLNCTEKFDSLIYVKGYLIAKSYRFMFTTVLVSGKAYYTDTSGFFNLTCKPGTYFLDIMPQGVKEMTIPVDLRVKSDTSITVPFKIFLGWFNIHSKYQLNEKEIENIKACIIENPSHNCREKNKYFVTIEI